MVQSLKMFVVTKRQQYFLDYHNFDVNVNGCGLSMIIHKGFWMEENKLEICGEQKFNKNIQFCDHIKTFIEWRR